MAPLKHLTLVGAHFILATAMGTDAGTQTTTYSVAFGNDGQCLAEINAARDAAGFSELKQAAKGETTIRLPDSPASVEEGGYATWAWNPVCEAVAKKTSTSPTSPELKAGDDFKSGTYAYQYVEDATSVNCTAVVDNWKAAYGNFSGVPPPYSKNEDVYKNYDSISFVTMYNPSGDATADCRVVTCTKTTPAAAEDDDDEDIHARTAQPGETMGSALICMTAPDVLPADGSKAPFTEDQWGQIVTAFEGSASTASPCLIGIAAAIVGLAML